MIRKSFLLQVKPGMSVEYERRHNPIWPEMSAVLLKYGVSNYSIFLHEPTGNLFGILDLESEELLREMSQEEICKKWWKYMSDVLICEENNPEKGIEEPLREVFRLNS